jgi:very-short-patch-repair endonuclease
MRDRRTTALLEKLGWRVIRLWENDIHANPQDAAVVVERTVKSRRRQDKRCVS